MNRKTAWICAVTWMLCNTVFWYFGGSRINKWVAIVCSLWVIWLAVWELRHRTFISWVLVELSENADPATFVLPKGTELYVSEDVIVVTMEKGRVSYFVRFLCLLFHQPLPRVLKVPVEAKVPK